MLSHEFMRDAYLGGTFVALAAGLAGWLIVLRGQVFAGDALGHVTFVGAIGAALVGVDQRIGLFALTLLVAAAIAGLRPGTRADDSTIGILFAWVLGLGALFVSLLATSSTAGNGIGAANALFGSILSLDRDRAIVAAAVGLAAVVALLTVARPLLFASLDPEVASVQGVAVRGLGLMFLLVVAIVTAEGAQAVGALLVLGLLAAPAGAAHAITARPWVGMALSAAIAVVATWGGLALSYVVPQLPSGTAIVGLAAIAFGVAALAARLRRSA